MSGVCIWELLSKKLVSEYGQYKLTMLNGAKNLKLVTKVRAWPKDCIMPNQSIRNARDCCTAKRRPGRSEHKRSPPRVTINKQESILPVQGVNMRNSNELATYPAS